MLVLSRNSRSASFRFVDTHGAVEDGYRASLGSEQALQVTLRGDELCKDDDLLFTVFTQNLIDGIKERFNFDIRVLELCLFGNSNDFFQFTDFLCCIKGNGLQRFFDAIFNIELGQIFFGQGSQLCR